MSKHKIVFPCEENLNTYLEVSAMESNTVLIEIYESNKSEFESLSQRIWLDKATSIKLVRVLKHEISKIQDNE